MSFSETPPSEKHLKAEVRSLVQNDEVAKSYGKMTFKSFFASRYVILSSSCAAIGGFLFGFDQGVISIILGMPQFLDQFPEINAAQSSDASFNQGLMTALLELGAAFGALQSGYAADKISRRYVLMLGTLWFLIGSTLQTAAFSFAQLVVGRFVGGIGIGTLACVAPLFIGEIAPPHLRGAMLVFESWMVVLGVVIAFYITYGTQHIINDWSFRLPFFLQMGPAFLLAGMIFFMPFSPRWLVLKGRDEEALECLAKLRRHPITDSRVQAEWVLIRSDVKAGRMAQDLKHPSLAHGRSSELRREILTWIDCFRSGQIQRTIIGIGLQFFQQFIGVNAIVYYAPTLYASLGLSRSTQLTYSGITNVMQLVGVTPAFFLMDRVGRRPLLLGGAFVCLICHLVTGSIVAKYYTNWPVHPHQAKVGVAMLMIFMFTFGLSWAPIPWAMPPEVNASSYRSKAVGLATVSNWVNNFIVGLITPVMVSHTHGYGAFFFFAAFSLLAIFFVYFMVPETRGVSLEEMDKKFKTHASVEDERRRQDVLQGILRHELNGDSTRPSEQKKINSDAALEIETV